MLNKLKQIFRKKTQQEKAEHQEMVKQIVHSSLASSCIVSVCIILFELFFFFNSIKHPKSFGSLGVWYRTCYLSLMIASAIGLGVVLFSWVKYDKRYRLVQWLCPIYSVMVTAWSLAITYLDCLKSQKCSPILFMTVILCVPACIYVPPIFYLVLDLLGSGIMLYMCIYAPGGGDSADILNFISFCVIQIIVSMFGLSTKYSYFQSVQQGLRTEKRARKAVEAKAATLSNMSHELRTPLNAILGMNEVLVQGDAEGQLTEYTDSIKLAGDTLLRLINDMLDYSKLEAGKMKVTVGSYSLSTMMDQVYTLISVLAERKGLDFRIQVENGTPDSLIGDGQRILQIIINLTNNAVKYTKKGSVLLKVRMDREQDSKAEVALKEAGGTGTSGVLVVEVVDTGIGIKEKDIPYLFDSYTQVEDDYNRHIEGTGLGLMICDKFLQLMQGKIGVESVYGKGSTFWFKLPQQVEKEEAILKTAWGKMETETRDSSRSVTAGADVSGRNITAGADVSGRNITAGTDVSGGNITVGTDVGGWNNTVGIGNDNGSEERKKRVLVVDDTEMNVMVFCKLLKKSQVIVDTADCGQLCLDMIEQQQYDMIFLDHIMPEMDGVETLQRIRAKDREWCKHVKVVALTANGGQNAQEEYQAMGFDDYLSKPIFLQRLLEIIYGE